MADAPTHIETLEPNNGSKERILAEDFRDEDLPKLWNLTNRLSTPESEEQIVPKWNQLTDEDRELLIRRYGPPQFIASGIKVVGRTLGEGCADNERAMPSGLNSKNYGIWDHCLVVYDLYRDRPNIQPHDKVRVIPARLVVGVGGRILLPDYFYTPKNSQRRELLLEQINTNPRGDLSLDLGQSFGDNLINSPNIELTIYREVGSRVSYGDTITDSVLGEKAMKKLGIDHLHQNDLIRYRQLIAISREVQRELSNMATNSNLLSVEQAFSDEAKTSLVQIKPGTTGLFLTNIDTGESVVFHPTIEDNLTIKWAAVKDPTWQFSETNTPWIFRQTRLEKNRRSVAYFFISNQEVLDIRQRENRSITG